MKKTDTGCGTGAYSHNPDIEIRVKGESFLTYHKGTLSMVPSEMPQDMSQLCKLMGVLSDALAMGLASQTLAMKASMGAQQAMPQQPPAMTVEDYNFMQNVFPLKPVKN